MSKHNRERRARRRQHKHALQSKLGRKLPGDALRALARTSAAYRRIGRSLTVRRVA